MRSHDIFYTTRQAIASPRRGGLLFFVEKSRPCPTIQGRGRGFESVRSAEGERHSHSMVAGGLEVTSRTTRLTSGTELVMRVEMRARTS